MDSELDRLRTSLSFIRSQVTAFNQLAPGNANLTAFIKTLRTVLDDKGETCDKNENDEKRKDSQNVISSSQSHLPVDVVKEEKSISASKGSSKKSKIATKRKESSTQASKSAELPAELTQLILPLQCNLCNVKLLSGPHANDHYTGKRHKNKVTIWLHDHSEQNKEKKEAAVAHGNEKEDEGVAPPSPKRGKTDDEPSESNPKSFCTICQIKLSSEINAHHHYEGRKHKKAKLLKDKEENEKETETIQCEDVITVDPPTTDS